MRVQGEVRFANNLGVSVFTTKRKYRGRGKTVDDEDDDEHSGSSHYVHLFTLQKSRHGTARIRPGWWPVNRGWLWIKWLLASSRRLTTSRSSTGTRPVLFAIRLSPLMIIVITIPCRSIGRTSGSSSRRRREIGESLFIYICADETGRKCTEPKPVQIDDVRKFGSYFIPPCVKAVFLMSASHDTHIYRVERQNRSTKEMREKNDQNLLRTIYRVKKRNMNISD